MVQPATRPELTVQEREVLGKKVKRLRRQGIIPANIYGHNVDSHSIQVPADEFKGLLRRAGRNEIVYLKLGSEAPKPTLVRHIQRDFLTDEILHIDFQQISLLEKVKLDVPIHLTGQAPGVTVQGGTLLLSLEHISVEGLPAEIPSHLEVDVSGLEEIDSAIHVRDLALPSGLNVLNDPDLVVAKVASTAKERAEAEALAAPVEEAAAEEVAAEEEAKEQEEE